MLKVEIDANAGFCGGVIRAITTSEKFLAGNDKLYSLGAIVHNEEELERLGALGLKPVASVDEVPEGEPVLVRAHGVPPTIYESARARGLQVIDCTCPVVLKLQKDIREASGQIIIFGKVGHPEVLGLVGQVSDNAVVVENLHQLKECVASGSVNVGEQTEIFSQTTKSPVEYEELIGWLSSVMTADLKVHRTICSQVASRHRLLSEFATTHDVIVFVSGKTSSNGKVLRDLCLSCNPRTYHVSSPEGLDPRWFTDGDSVGISGATSTPKWLLVKVAEAIENLH